jgi:thiamine-monophosphate kinase
MIDISDGLSSDLNHICAASGVGARIDYSKIPVDLSLKKHEHDDRITDLILHGGEDFELLFTVSPEKISSLENLPITRIGKMASNSGIIELARDGKTEILEPKGYRHF